ncbi:ornithine decarboxylase [Cuspidothrix issatschenkoi CHARLIE-1]|uniref:ornithine decarboxylase n=1 Tax=Cuspidothrix issatschenkoi CHARLIE-1 TaxID=2052836 RepID=A0A2S6CP02_9CYAN|nr:ornithine decarboxylase [Cuspidothrix issatschenkoi CHARLIE-1]
MNFLKVAASEKARDYVNSDREIVSIHDNSTDFVDVGAIILMDYENVFLESLKEELLDIPVLLVTNYENINNKHSNNKIDLESVDFIIDINNFNIDYVSKKLDYLISKYEKNILPPFFNTLVNYSERGNIQFDCPGHQGGQYFTKHPAGKQFYNFFGENLFRADICNADVDLGDLLIHEGPAVEAQKHAAKVYNADKTYFVMNGSTTSNNIAITSAIMPDDLVLFDRNNHKSAYNSALVKDGGRPVYMQTSRDSYGFIGGIYEEDFDEKYLREQAAKVDPERAKWERPFRLAIIQLGTYDGTIYNAKKVVEKIGHLCDYILFDSAWVGYEQFIPLMKKSSPLLLDLDENDPGILVVQSTHKQQAGFSQASQIHKKDKHIKGQKRYINHKRFNNAYMQYASTSPFYPLFASLDINAKMQEGKLGEKLWNDCLTVSTNARKTILKNCKYIKPFIPETVHGENWEKASTEEIISNLDYWKFNPDEKWHGFKGYGKDQYYIDPNKFLLTTPGINSKDDSYKNFGIPAVILANYLRENGIIPEKNDLNSILFLMTPAEDTAKMNNLIAKLIQFEKYIDQDAPLEVVLPRLYYNNYERYKNYTICELCQELHDFYKEHNTKEFQKKMFLKDYLPEYSMKPYDANIELLKNNAKLVDLDDIVGEIALEGALPYPPGIFCVVPGEKWNETAKTYFKILEEGINEFPGFAPEIQGVYFEKVNDRIKAFGYVLDK